MASVNTLCSYDKDCPMNEVCYSNITWKMNEANKGNMCDCSTYYGYKRNPTTGLCTDWDINAYFWMASGLFISFLSFCLFIVGIYNTIKLYSFNKLTGVLATTCALTSISLLGIVLSGIGLFLDAWMPIYNPVTYSDTTNDQSDKMGKFTQFERIPFTLCMLFGILASLNIPLFWLEVVERSKNVNVQLIQNITRFRKPLIFIELFVGSTLVIVGLILGYFTITTLIGIPFVLGITGIYFYCLYKMKSMFQTEIGDGHQAGGDPNSSTKNQNQVISEFQRAARIIVFGLILFLGSSFSYSVVSFLITWREACKPGTLSYLIVLIWLTRLALFISCYGIISYIHRRVVKIMKKKKKERSSDPASSNASTTQGKGKSGQIEPRTSNIQPRDNKGSTLAPSQPRDLGQEIRP